MTVLLVGPDADTLGVELADHGIEALAADDAAEVLAWMGDRHAPLDLSAVGLIAWAGDAVPSEVADLRAATGFEVCAVADLAGLLDLLDERGCL